MDDDYAETLIPTMGLRFVQRTAKVAREAYGGGTYDKTYHVLQQRFTTTGGREVWRDVPTSREDPHA